MSAWYRERGALAFIGKRYLPLFALFNLLWEFAQLPLYTIWREASAGYLALAVTHCTGGDVLIGAAALALALAATRAGPIGSWRWRSVIAIATVVGVAYTIASEWTNTALRPVWQYSPLMPTIRLGGIRIGLSPLLQWLILPPLALHLARPRTARPFLARGK